MKSEVPKQEKTVNLQGQNASLTVVKESRQKSLKENYYFDRIDKFIKNYEAKYEKKVKLKKSKKEK